MIQNYKRNKALSLIAARVETALSGNGEKTTTE